MSFQQPPIESAHRAKTRRLSQELTSHPLARHRRRDCEPHLSPRQGTGEETASRISPPGKAQEKRLPAEMSQTTPGICQQHFKFYPDMSHQDETKLLSFNHIPVI
ncbi:hypothetical protein BsWGS_25021 [Bradybaena similaris]